MMDLTDFSDKLLKLQGLIDNSNRIVFFGGAGVSTESGIKDFRSKDGLYNEKYKYPPETILSHSFFMRHTEEFYDFYRDKLMISGVLPNVTHNFLSDLERAGKLSAVVTQNIDGLHSSAGSKRVYELHGSLLRNYCMKCGKFFDEKYIYSHGGVPRCDDCGGIIKPDVVLYEEQLDDDTVIGAVNSIADADLLIVGGTSLAVYPAAGLIRYYSGKDMVLINRDPTPYDHFATLVINDSLGKVFGSLKV